MSEISAELHSAITSNSAIEEASNEVRAMVGEIIDRYVSEQIESDLPSKQIVNHVFDISNLLATRLSEYVQYSILCEQE